MKNFHEYLSLIRSNWEYKAGALFIAIIIWTMINRAIGPASALPEQRSVIKQVPVFILGRAEQGEVILRPEQVDVNVRGTPEAIRQVKHTDVRLYVDISGLRGNARDSRRVQWSVSAPGVQVDSTSPRVVEVELR